MSDLLFQNAAAPYPHLKLSFGLGIIRTFAILANFLS